MRSEREVRRSIPIELSAPEGLQCAASIELEYTQRDTIARVRGVIDNETCAASDGTYEIEARIVNADGDTETLVFMETWQREDDQPVPFAADFPLGENVELLRLRSRDLSCSCGDTQE